MRRLAIVAFIVFAAGSASAQFQIPVTSVTSDKPTDDVPNYRQLFFTGYIIGTDKKSVVQTNIIHGFVDASVDLRGFPNYAVGIVRLENISQTILTGIQCDINQTPRDLRVSADPDGNAIKLTLNGTRRVGNEAPNHYELFFTCYYQSAFPAAKLTEDKDPKGNPLGTSSIHFSD
jgi:hypothetical protein